MKAYFRKKIILFAIFILAILSTIGLFVLRHSKLKEISLEIKEMVSEGYTLREGTLQVALEEYFMEEVMKGLSLKDAYGSFHKVLGKNEIDHFYYIKGNDGMLYYGSLVKEKVDTFKYAKRVQKAMAVAEDKGAKTLFIMLPSKIIHGMTDLQSLYLVNDRNAIQDEMLLNLQYMGVPFLDLRIAMKESGYSLEELFYKTDNGWTTKGAFVAAKAIANSFKVKFNDDIDPNHYYFDEKQYVEESWEGNYGSFTRRAGAVFAGTDSFTTMYPRFDTWMEWNDLDHNQTVEGRFEDTLLTFEWKESELEPNPVSDLYLSGIIDYGRIINHKNPEGPKILCLRDSNFSAVASFLAPICSQLDLIYARSSETDIDYEKLIEDGDYDYLMIVGNPFNIDDVNFNFYAE